MTTSEMVRALCEKKDVALAELCRRIGQSPQNFGKKLKRDSLAYTELSEVAVALDANFEMAFTLPDGYKISADTERNYDYFPENKIGKKERKRNDKQASF